MSYRIAGIDVHKRMLAVVVSEVEVYGEYSFERRTFGTSQSSSRSSRKIVEAFQNQFTRSLSLHYI